MSEYGKPIYGTVKEESPVVQTTHGKIKGEGRDGVGVFRGIPYGDRVDGENRFQPPKPAPDWDDVRDCTKNGPIAVQFGTSISGSGDFGDYFSGGKPELFRCDEEVQDENCLVLDVMTPGIDEKKRPVVVYIHGGGFSSGSGSLVLGSDLWVKEEDIVVVGVNHRLNVFGYLNLSAFDKKYAESGMAGMLDVVLALEWVRDNIAAFGGDPKKVTIMGESGGGGKVNHMIALEKAKGLFRAAIVESGSGAAGTTSAEDATIVTKALLEELDIPEEQFEKLLQIPAQELLQASGKFGMMFGPSADGINLDHNPTGAYTEADPTLPLMVGASAEEVAAFAEPQEMTWEQVRAKLISGESAEEAPAAEPDAKGRKNWAAKLPKRNGGLGSTPGITSENVDEVIRVFRENDTNGADPYRILLRIQSQCSFLGAGAYKQALEKATKNAAPIYNYYVTFAAPHPRHPESSYAWHTADLPLQMRVVAHENCEKISKEMAHAWAAFIRTGNPGTEELPWPAFTVENQQTMVFSEDSHVEVDPTKPYRQFIK